MQHTMQVCLTGTASLAVTALQKETMQQATKGETRRVQVHCHHATTGMFQQQDGENLP